jgi:hypothetical protein
MAKYQYGTRGFDMVDMTKWEGNKVLTPEEEPEYMKDFCAYLREQQKLNPEQGENGEQVFNVVPDDIAAHAADIIEELWGRLDKYYIQGIQKGMELKADELAYEAIKKA